MGKRSRLYDDTGEVQRSEESKSTDVSTERLEELMKMAEPMVEQVTNLYKQYSTGIERLPPLEVRKRLEQLMDQIQNMPKPQPSYRMRAATLHSHFVTYRDYWDRLMRDVETGKIKRPIRNKTRQSA